MPRGFHAQAEYSLRLARIVGAPADKAQLSRLLGGAAFVCIGTIAANAALWNRADSLDWQSFKVPEYGTRLEYPAKIFVAAGEAEKGVGQRFESSDGRAVLSVYVRENEDGDTPASY